MKRINVLSITSLCIIMLCVGLFITEQAFSLTIHRIIKESPKKVNLQKYNHIHLGWLDLRGNDWKKYQYEKKENWVAVINQVNLNGIGVYLKKRLSGKKVTGASSKADTKIKGDLYIKLNYVKIVPVRKGVDELHVNLTFINGKTKKTIYSASVAINSKGVFPRNWKGSTFDGRVDNEIYNLAKFIASKFE